MALLLVHSADDQHLVDAGLARTGHHLVAVRVELRHVDVGMAVDKDESRRACHSTCILVLDSNSDTNHSAWRTVDPTTSREGQ